MGALARLKPTCLERALVLEAWLAAEGTLRDVVIGVLPDGMKSAPAHAWVDGTHGCPLVTTWSCTGSTHRRQGTEPWEPDDRTIQRCLRPASRVAPRGHLPRRRARELARLATRVPAGFPHEREPEHIGPDDALLNLRPRGQVLIERQTRTSTFLLPTAPRPVAWPIRTSPPPQSWRPGGRDGVRSMPGVRRRRRGVGGFLGKRGDGKSTMLAWLSAHGHEIVCDDVLIADEGNALAGPRCIDLRQSASRHFEMGTYIGRIGTRQRWRALWRLSPPPSRCGAGSCPSGAQRPM